MSEKPLNVRVAEALNWTDCQSNGVRDQKPCPSCRGLKTAPDSPAIPGCCNGTGLVGGVEKWVGIPPERCWCLRPQGVCACEPGWPNVPPMFSAIPDFEHDWSATGPLIEKYQICTERDSVGWWAWAYGLPVAAQHADTPTLAACRLLLALHEAGRLTP